MAEVVAQDTGRSQSHPGVRMAAVVWVLTSIFYFYQYALRSAPSVMMPQLEAAFGLTTLGIASIVGLFYYGYSPFSLIAGAALDGLGPRRLVPFAAAAVGIGSMLFATGNTQVASIGRFIQGAGGVFALVGAIYIATRNFPASKAATLIGATQMFGMAGGSAGQFLVGPMIGKGLNWSTFWIAMGIAGILLGILLYFLTPSEKPGGKDQASLKTISQAFAMVFKNPQSILCGLIAGLLFIPTTIFDMVWGVRYLQEARGLDYASAVMRSAAVPFGWVIGCPLLGYISDKIGRRKPVIIGAALVLMVCLVFILYGRLGLFPPYGLGLMAGVASGAAMLPYSVIKEVNPPQFSGTAVGVINFLNFTFSALLGPAFGWVLHRLSGGAAQLENAHFQIGFAPFVFGVAIAIILTLFLKETGSAARRAVTVAT